MLLLGIREQTVDVDIKLDPEPQGAFEAIARLKNDLDINVELASPDDFLPPLPNWKGTSIPIQAISGVAFFHYCLRAQALAKLERGHEQDLEDVAELIRRTLVQPQELLAAFESIKPMLIRYPAVNPLEFQRKVERFLSASGT